MQRTEQIEKIKEMCDKNITTEDIAKSLGLRYMQVWHIINNNNFKKTPKKQWWNENDVEKIKKLIEIENRTLKDVGNIFNKKDFHILAVMNRFNIKSNFKITEEEKLIIKSLYLEGNTIDEIEKITKIGHSSISIILRGFSIIPKSTRIRSLNKDLLQEGKRYCSSCQKRKSIELFHGNICRECERTVEKIRYKINSQNPTIEEVAKYKIKSSKERAKKIKKEFSLTEEDFLELYVKQNGRCYYTNESLGLLRGSEDALSIDRIDSSKGYSKENCVLCLYRINLMKNDMQMEHFVKLCKLVTDNCLF